MTWLVSWFDNWKGENVRIKETIKYREKKVAVLFEIHFQDYLSKLIFGKAF